MSRFNIKDLPLADLKCLTRQHLGDARGFLSRLFCADELSMAGWRKPIVQINHTYTSCSGSIRGLHYQNPPYSEMKLISCIRGEVWDVAVDLRAGSSTFLQWHAEILSAENGNALLIPEGFAHGFQTISNDCELLYLHTATYAPEAESGLRYDDPQLDIPWRLPVADISERDRSHPLLTPQFGGIKL